MVHQVTHMGLTRIIQIPTLNHNNNGGTDSPGNGNYEAIIVIMMVALHIKETRTQTIVQTITIESSIAAL